ncbi:MAG: recombination protein RecR [Candidatus Vogelbacteria bacterium]|nr:recombination protein RecR [Candidatus Vogelbacteria bacterium]
MDEPIEKLVSAFLRFPGIGPRQARRFVYYLLAQNAGIVENLAKDLLELKKQINQCQNCYRFFVGTKSKINGVCDFCQDPTRDLSTLMVVEKDTDLEVVRKSGQYAGQFFILGGLVPILEPEPEKRIRARELRARLKSNQGQLKEIIIALAANAEGDNTTDYLQKILTPAGLKISVLGRGLSTGTELEYSDAATLKNALKNRA